MIMSSERLLARTDGWKVFAERRLVRVVPLYWVLTTVKVLLTAFTAGFTMYTVLTPRTIFSSYFFLPAPNAAGDLEPIMGVGWTLNFEMFFYLLFTTALLLKQNVYRFVGVLLTLLAVGAYFRKPGWPAARFYLDTIVLEFFVGMCIAWLCQRRRTLSTAWAVAAVLAGFAGLLTWPLLPENTPRILMIGIPAGLVVYGTASLEPRLHRIPRFVLFLAEASYATYLIHPMAAPLGPVLCAKLHIPSVALSVSLALLLGLLAGLLVYRFVDLPLTAFFKRHVTNRGKQVVHTPPVIPDGAS